MPCNSDWPITQEERDGWALDKQKRMIEDVLREHGLERVSGESPPPRDSSCSRCSSCVALKAELDEVTSMLCEWGNKWAQSESGLPVDPPYRVIRWREKHRKWDQKREEHNDQPKACAYGEDYNEMHPWWHEFYTRVKSGEELNWETYYKGKKNDELKT